MNEITFLHFGTIGDVWASLPTMKEYHRKTGKKVTLLLGKDVPAIYYEGATHPTRNAAGEQVSLNERMIEMMTPLLMAQEYIFNVRTWDGEEKIHVDLNRFRDSDVFIGMPNGAIQRWYFYVFPNLTCDITVPWMRLPDTDIDYANGKIIVARTERYRNSAINYSFIKKYEDDVLFAGTMKEYNIFCQEFDLEVRKLNVENFLQLAQAVKQSRFLLSNQTQIFQIAEAIKHPRIVELCDKAQNVIPMGDKAFDFYDQPGLEYYFSLLAGEDVDNVVKTIPKQ